MWYKYYLGVINSILYGTNTFLVRSTIYYVVQILSSCDQLYIMWYKYYLGVINSMLCGSNTILVCSTLCYMVQILSCCDQFYTIWYKYYLRVINSIICGTNTILVWSTLYYVVQILSWCDPDVLCTQLVPLFATCTGLRWHFYNGYYMGVGVTLISIIVSPLVYYCDSQQYFFGWKRELVHLLPLQCTEDFYM